ncbi:MAG: ABC transporter substrate-binding protein, partial [Verrucomicrobia bacterium]|nr:ABC transporter substrate-binding protein [Verrucomicrobiota bacterium]
APTAVPKGGVIRLKGSGGRNKFYTPLWYYGTTAWGNTMAHIWPGLITFNEKDDAVPHLAEKFEITPDAKSITFYLPKGAKWSDGVPLTAKDVKWTYEILLKPGFLEFAGNAWGMFEATKLAGGADYAAGKATEISGIVAVDDSTVRFDLAMPDVTFVRMMMRSIAPQHLYDGDDTFEKMEANAFTSNPTVHSGPFRLAAYVETEYIMLEAVRPYWLNTPLLHEANVDKIIMFQNLNAETGMAKMEAGEIDVFKRVTGDSLNRAKDMKGAQLLITMSSSFSGTGVNARKEYLKDKRVRQAMMYAIDRDVVNTLENEGMGTPIASPVNTPDWAVNPDINPYPHDVEKAKTLLTEAGWDFDREIIFQSFVEGEDPMASYIQQALGEAGIKVSISHMAYSGFYDIMEQGDLDLWRESGYDAQHPSLAASYFMCAATNATWAGYCNKELDELIGKASATLDAKEAQELGWKISAIMNDELPYLWGTQMPQAHLVSDRVGNFIVTPTNWATTYGAADWYLKP